MKYAPVLLVLFQLSFGQGVRSGEDVIKHMHDRYVRTAPKTVMFTQKTIEYQPNGTSKESIWHESVDLPGKLRIRFAPLDSGNGLLFIRDSMFIFRSGKVARSQPLIHPIILLAYDSYHLPLAETLRKLKELKFDLSVIHEDTWENKPVYVVGAASGDLKSKQFWIDKERLILLRIIDVVQPSGVMVETQLSKHKKIGDAWIETEVKFFRNGTMTMQEHYLDVRFNVPLDERLFMTENGGRREKNR